MNITKLTFLLRRKLRNSLIFRNFTILSAAIILFPSGVFAQEENVSIHIKNGTVKTFMKQVEQQTRYTFVYRNHVLNDQTKVTISCTKKPISEALSQVFTPLNISYSFTKNKLLSLDGVLDMKINGGGANTGKVMHALMVGKPVSAFYMLRQDGIYQTDQEVPSKLYAKGVRAGDCKYFDYNNDGDITDDDRMYVGKVTPDIYGGITSTMNWKNFDLSIFCQFAAGGKILSAWKGCGGTEGTEHLGLASSSIKGYKNGTLVDSEQFYNISKYAANHYWRGEGTSNTVPRPTLAGTFTGGFGNNLVSTRYLEDASYFKFKTITLGYSLPHSLLSKIHVTGARIFVSLDNFFTLTKYSGYDPEFSYESNPTGNSYGADFGEQATLKSFIIGASINF